MYLPFLSDKSKALDAFKIYKVEVEKQLGKQIKIVKVDTPKRDNYMVCLQGFYKNKALSPNK